MTPRDFDKQPCHVWKDDSSSIRMSRESDDEIFLEIFFIAIKLYQSVKHVFNIK